MNILRASLFVTILGFSLLSGCSLIRQTDAPMKESTLSAAGFQARPVNTPKREADLASLTPFRVNVTTHKGKTLYLYPDPKQKVIYAGGPKEYAAYKKLARKQYILAEKQMSNTEWDYWAQTYGYGFAGNPSVIY